MIRIVLVLLYRDTYRIVKKIKVYSPNHHSIMLCINSSIPGTWQNIYLIVYKYQLCVHVMKAEGPRYWDVNIRFEFDAWISYLIVSNVSLVI